MSRPIAALYVQDGGAYYGLDGVDPWPESRDARTYAGPHPVVAHPPCERWGRYWHGGPSARVRRVKGDDGGCFAAALESVRRWGGVLEHPEASAAWDAFGLHRPPRWGGWVVADDIGGWTCCVEQAHYGHRARKATWLYAYGVELPSLRWGRAEGVARLDDGCHSAEERAARRSAGTLRTGVRRMTGPENAATPSAFRELLISIARSARQSPPAVTRRAVDPPWTRRPEGRMGKEADLLTNPEGFEPSTFGSGGPLSPEQSRDVNSEPVHGGSTRRLVLSPITVKRGGAIGFVGRTHRRLPRVQGAMWATSVRDAATGELLGVVLVGHPSQEQTARGDEPIEHLRVLRCAVREGVPNACSMLYSAAWRAARALGALRMDTHTHLDEPGTSLRAAGWVEDGLTDGGEHDRPSRRRKPAVDPRPKRRWWAPGSVRKDGRQSPPAGRVEEG